MVGRKPPGDGRRPLTPDERAAWNRVAQTVQRTRTGDSGAPSLPAIERPAIASPKALKSDSFLTVCHVSPSGRAPRSSPSPVLDRQWERRISGGQLVPERSVDLHGHSLAAAHRLFSRVLAEAVHDQVRVLLVVTGKPRESLGADQAQRGAIAREVGHWIETSPQADRIASVRRAHPRHGGAGALYLILRRRKEP